MGLTQGPLGNIAERYMNARVAQGQTARCQISAGLATLEGLTPTPTDTHWSDLRLKLRLPERRRAPGATVLGSQAQ